LKRSAKIGLKGGGRGVVFRLGLYRACSLVRTVTKERRKTVGWGFQQNSGAVVWNEKYRQFGIKSDMGGPAKRALSRWGDGERTSVLVGGGRGGERRQDWEDVRFHEVSMSRQAGSIIFLDGGRGGRGREEAGKKAFEHECVSKDGGEGSRKTTARKGGERRENWGETVLKRGRGMGPGEEYTKKNK